jgi:hypothetical protein
VSPGAGMWQELLEAKETKEAAAAVTAWMNPVPPRGYVGGNKKNRSHSQMSVQHANNKNKLVDFAVVSGWTALAGRWCSASSACFSTELQVYLNGQWCELFELQVMMCHGHITPLLCRNNVCGNTHQK